MANVINRTTVKALIEKDGKVLILKDEKGVWELPGGKIDNSESEEETLRRELNEELGIENAKIGQKIHTFDFEVNFKDTLFQFHAIVRLCEIDEQSLVISPEHSEIKWIEIEDIKNYKMREGYAEAVAKYQKEYL